MTLYDTSKALLDANLNNLVGKDHFTFVYFGDTRGNGKGTGPLSQINETILKEILNHINNLPETPTFILHGGDITYQGTIDNLNRFMQIIASISQKNTFFYHTRKSRGLSTSEERQSV